MPSSSFSFRFLSQYFFLAWTRGSSVRRSPRVLKPRLAFPSSLQRRLPVFSSVQWPGTVLEPPCPRCPPPTGGALGAAAEAARAAAGAARAALPRAIHWMPYPGPPPAAGRSSRRAFAPRGRAVNDEKEAQYYYEAPHAAYRRGLPARAGRGAGIIIHKVEAVNKALRGLRKARYVDLDPYHWRCWVKRPLVLLALLQAPEPTVIQFGLPQARRGGLTGDVGTMNASKLKSSSRARSTRLAV